MLQRLNYKSRERPQLRYDLSMSTRIYNCTICNVNQPTYTHFMDQSVQTKAVENTKVSSDVKTGGNADSKANKAPSSTPSLASELSSVNLTSSWNKGQICIIGQGRAGKSSLVCSFLGQPIDKVLSTVGIATEQFSCNASQLQVGSSAAWSKASDTGNTLEQHLARNILEKRNAVPAATALRHDSQRLAPGLAAAHHRALLEPRRRRAGCPRRPQGNCP